MTAAERIQARIKELEGIHERYTAYQQDRIREKDHHGAWDVAVNLSETECEMAGLRFALEQLATLGDLRVYWAPEGSLLPSLPGLPSPTDGVAIEWAGQSRLISLPHLSEMLALGGYGVQMPEPKRRRARP